MDPGAANKQCFMFFRKAIKVNKMNRNSIESLSIRHVSLSIRMVLVIIRRNSTL